MLIRGHSSLLHNQQDIVGHRKVAEDTRLLGQIANPQTGPLVHRQVSDINLIQANSSLIRSFEASGDIKGSGFTCPIRPQQAHDFPLTYGQTNLVHYPPPTIGFANVIKDNFQGQS
jgi:hypothetical protein